MLIHLIYLADMPRQSFRPVVVGQGTSRASFHRDCNWSLQSQSARDSSRVDCVDSDQLHDINHLNCVVTNAQQIIEQTHHISVINWIPVCVSLCPRYFDICEIKAYVAFFFSRLGSLIIIWFNNNCNQTCPSFVACWFCFILRWFRCTWLGFVWYR